MEEQCASPTQDAHEGRRSFLIWGGRGWIAGQLFDLLKVQGREVHSTTLRMEDRRAVLDELDRVKPTHVLNCAGVTGRPNVDWCEDNKEETVRSNVIGTLNLADCCYLSGIHCTIYATGCIYTFNPPDHPMTCPPGTGYTETDTANFSGSFYSLTKSHTERLLHLTYPRTTLILRLRMPVTSDLHPRNFVTKITSYAHVVDTPNSNTILSDLLPASIILATHHESGIYNFTNPGAISHNQVLTLYRDIVDPDFTWKNFSLEDQARVIKAGRSNCMLDTTKLESKLGEYGVRIPEVNEAYRACFARMKENLKRNKKEGGVVREVVDENKEKMVVVMGEDGKENELPVLA